MQWLTQLFQAIQAGLSMLGSFAAGIWALLQMLPGALGMVTSSITSMPMVLTAFATAMISISVVYLIIGR